MHVRVRVHVVGRHVHREEHDSVAEVRPHPCLRTSDDSGVRTVSEEYELGVSAAALPAAPQRMHAAPRRARADNETSKLSLPPLLSKHCRRPLG